MSSYLLHACPGHFDHDFSTARQQVHDLALCVRFQESQSAVRILVQQDAVKLYQLFICQGDAQELFHLLISRLAWA